MRRKSCYLARKIWIKHYGSIPKDEQNRSYEIHHIDGDPHNNNICNLMCLSIKDHFLIHLKNEDWGAVTLISKRLNLPPNVRSNIQTGKKRPGIGGVPKGTIPWNKGKKGCFNKEVIQKFKMTRKGKRFGKVKIDDGECLDIIKLYNSKPFLEQAYKKSKNGRIISYETAFAKELCKKYSVTSLQIYNIITGKRNVSII